MELVASTSVQVAASCWMSSFASINLLGIISQEHGFLCEISNEAMYSTPYLFVAADASRFSDGIAIGNAHQDPEFFDGRYPLQKSQCRVPQKTPRRMQDSGRLHL